MTSRSRRSRLGGWLAVLALLVGLLAPRRAEASDAMLGIALVGWAGVAVVAPIGAMVNVVERTPSKTWGRTSLVAGGISTALGAGLLIGGAFADGDDELFFNIAGGVALGIGVNGLLWGIATEATLPKEDPGIPGPARPLPAPTMFTVEGTF